jgi:hypothetical protein
MKKLALLLRLTCAAALASGIQTSALAVPSPQTNAVQHINIELTFLTQGPSLNNSPHTNDIRNTVIKTSITTKDVISWLSAATGTNFPAGARLVRVKHFNASTNNVSIEVRYSTNRFDVSQFFNNSTSSEKIDASTRNVVTGLSSGKEYENVHIVYTNSAAINPAPFFHISGAATVDYVSVKSGKTVLVADEVSPTFMDDLAGAGEGTNGVPALVTGSVTFTGTTTEVK